MGSDAQYLAGLWLDSFSEGLAWSWFKGSTAEESLESRAVRQTVPSWSWAAASGPVMFPRNICQFPPRMEKGYECYSKIIKAECLPMTLADPKGRVMRGTLCIQGPIVDVAGAWCSCELGLKHISEEWQGNRGARGSNVWLDDFNHPRSEDVEPPQSRFLWLYGHRKPTGNGKVISEAYALLLRAVSSAEPTYRRVGLIWASAYEGPGPLELHGTRNATVTIV